MNIHDLMDAAVIALEDHFDELKAQGAIKDFTIEAYGSSGIINMHVKTLKSVDRIALTMETKHADRISP
jgi:hypothetical protein